MGSNQQALIREKAMKVEIISLISNEVEIITFLFNFDLRGQIILISGVSVVVLLKLILRR